MQRVLLCLLASLGVVASITISVPAGATPSLNISSSVRPVVTQQGRHIHVVIRVTTGQAQNRVDITDHLPEGIVRTKRGPSSPTVHPRPSADGTLGWKIRHLEPHHPVYIHWKGVVTGETLSARNVVHARSASSSARSAGKVFVARTPDISYSGHASRRPAYAHMRRTRSSSPYFVRWEAHRGAVVATSSTSYDRKRKERVTESFRPRGPRVRVRLQVVNLRDSHPLRVNGALIQRTLDASSGRRIAWIKSPHIHTVLRPHESVGATFVYKMPSGNYELTGHFRPS